MCCGRGGNRRRRFLDYRERVNYTPHACGYDQKHCRRNQPNATTCLNPPPRPKVSRRVSTRRPCVRVNAARHHFIRFIRGKRGRLLAFYPFVGNEKIITGNRISSVLFTAQWSRAFTRRGVRRTAVNKHNSTSPRQSCRHPSGQITAVGPFSFFFSRPLGIVGKRRNVFSSTRTGRVVSQPPVPDVLSTRRADVKRTS